MAAVSAGGGAGRGRPRVDVRIGPRGRALRVDGTLASWYVPGRVTTGSVWDAIGAPLLLLPSGRRRSVLILGLGGGSAARVVRALAPTARIVGVERNREVLAAARRWFDLDALGVEIVCDDAERVLERERRRFDAVLDDVFVGPARAVRKPDWLARSGLAAAARRLRRGGILVSNTLDETGAVRRELFRLFAAVLRVDVDGYDNRILVGAPAGSSARGLRAAVSADALLSPALARLSFRTLCSGGRSRAVR